MVKGKVMLVGVGLAAMCVLIAGVASEARPTTIIWRGIIAALLAGGVTYLAGALLDAKTATVMAEFDAEEALKAEKSAKDTAKEQDSTKGKKETDEAQEKNAADKTDGAEKKDGDDFKPMDGDGLTHLTAP